MSLHLIDNYYPQHGENISCCWKLDSRRLDNAVNNGDRIFLHKDSRSEAFVSGIITGYNTLENGRKSIIFIPDYPTQDFSWPGGRSYGGEKRWVE